MSATKDYPVLETETRTKLGTRYSKRVRDAGRIPAVIYGHKQDPVHISLHGKTFEELLHDEVHIIDVKIDGKSEHTLLKSVQWDTYGIHVLHVDLERVDLSETVEVEIEVQLIGEPAALKQGGTVLDHPLQNVQVSCRADSIPSHLEHNIAELGTDDQVTVGDLVAPEGVKILTDPEQLICQISAVKAQNEEETEDGADAATPEVIGKDKGEEGDDKD